MACVDMTTGFATNPWDFKFRPSDEEKMEYLASKATGSASDLMIGTADAYGEKEPWEIFGNNELDTELCFFTPLKKVGNNKNPKSTTSRISRNVGQGGFWSNKGQKDAVYGRKGGVVGYKRCFRYERKKGDDDDDDYVDKYGKWLLKEYTLPDYMRSRVKEEYKDYALCVLKRKKESAAARINNNTPDVEIGFDEMLASIISNHHQSVTPVPVPVEEDWLHAIDWDELANFDHQPPATSSYGM